MSLIRRDEHQAVAWAAQLARAARAARLNRGFLPHGQWSAHLQACIDDELRIDTDHGLPSARCWSRARIASEQARADLDALEAAPLDALAPADRERLERRRRALSRRIGLDPLPPAAVEVAWRGWESERRASYRVQVDRLDPAEGTAARWVMVLVDEPGERFSPERLETRASDAFTDLALAMATQDAALTFAALQAQPQLEVLEVTRGVIGPVAARWTDGVFTGPRQLEGFAGPVLTALFERAAPDVPEGAVDDPLELAVTVPAADAGFRVARHRKWALPRAQVPALRAWLMEHGSRGLVYGC